MRVDTGDEGFPGIGVGFEELAIGVVGVEDEPGIVGDFLFELACAPTGVTDESEGVGGIDFLGVGGVVDAKLLRKSIPIEHDEEDAVATHRTAEVEDDVGEKRRNDAHIESLEGLGGGAVYDEAEGPSERVVSGEIDDAATEIRIVQVGVGKKQFSGEVRRHRNNVRQ